jgi:hypothetical protein
VLAVAAPRAKNCRTLPLDGIRRALAGKNSQELTFLPHCGKITQTMREPDVFSPWVPSNNTLITFLGFPQENPRW